MMAFVIVGGAVVTGVLVGFILTYTVIGLGWKNFKFDLRNTLGGWKDKIFNRKVDC